MPHRRRKPRGRNARHQNLPRIRHFNPIKNAPLDHHRMESPVKKEVRYPIEQGSRRIERAGQYRPHVHITSLQTNIGPVHRISRVPADREAVGHRIPFLTPPIIRRQGPKTHRKALARRYRRQRLVKTELKTHRKLCNLLTRIKHRQLVRPGRRPRTVRTQPQGTTLHRHRARRRAAQCTGVT